MRLLLPLVLLAACAQTHSISLSDDTGASADTQDTDPTGDDSGGGDTDTDTDTDTDLEPVPDYSVWDGERNFYYDYSDYGYTCDDTVAETGEAVPEGSGDYAALADLCADCDYFYEVTPESDSACDWISLGTTWRGVVLGDGEAEVYLFRENYGDLEMYASDTHAEFDGVRIDYAYDYDYDYITVQITGDATYPLVDPG